MWGYKYTAFLYFKKGNETETLTRLIEVLNREFEDDAEFIGIRYDKVVEEPKESGGS